MAFSSFRASKRAVSLIALVGVGALLLAGCASASDGGRGDSAATLVPEDAVGKFKSEVPKEFQDGLTAATQADIAPLTYVNDDGQVVGFDQDLLTALSEVLGVPIKVETVTFENLLLGLESGNFDFIGDTTISNERMQKYDMLTYHAGSWSTVTTADAENIGSEETDLCGASVGVVSAELIVGYISDVIDPQCDAAGLEPVKTTEYKDIAAAILATGSGNVDAIVVDSMTSGYFLTSEEGAKYKFNGPERMSASVGGYSFLKSDTHELADAVQSALTYLMDEGIYQELLEKYGQSVLGIESAPELNPTVAR